jgi:hypothetical protein
VSRLVGSEMCIRDRNRSVMIPKRSSGIGQNYFPTPISGPIESRLN